MTTYDNAKELSKLTLGKTTEYCSKYNPNLLQGVPRSLNRDDLSLKDDSLPFIGEDVWYGYELSWLNAKGKPVVMVAEFRFPCTSPNLVESKSFKLYLNSFNQSRFENINMVEELLTSDLSQTAGEKALVTLFPVDNCPPLQLKSPFEASICIDDADITVEQYQYTPDVLVDLISPQKQETRVSQILVSHLLKSNCLITNQPDWASIYIQYKGQQINQTVLLQYLISFRQHNEFHEQCVERIYCDLQKHGVFEELSVFARYTRRGGLDINPFRSSNTEKAPNGRTLRQ